MGSRKSAAKPQKKKQVRTNYLTHRSFRGVARAAFKAGGKAALKPIEQLKNRLSWPEKALPVLEQLIKTNPEVRYAFLTILKDARKRYKGKLSPKKIRQIALLSFSKRVTLPESLRPSK